MNEKVTILIATAARPELLFETLGALLEQECDAIELDILVADNSASPHKSNCMDALWDDRRIHRISSVTRGRSRAVNKALKDLSADIVIFTDDDVTPASHWLHELISSFRNTQEAILVCGPIKPVFPSACPMWLDRTAIGGVAYAHFAPDIANGPLPLGLLPLGPNFAVRRHAIDTLEFREDLGPSEANGPMSCDDVAFVTELRARYLPLISGGGFFYNKAALVEHRIRPEQMHDLWVYDRFFNYGRSVTAMRRRLNYFQSPSCLVRGSSLPSAETDGKRSIELSYYLGQVRQLRLLGEHDAMSFLAGWLRKYDLLDGRITLGDAGRTEADRIRA